VDDDGTRVIDAAHRFQPPAEPDDSVRATVKRIEGMFVQVFGGTSPNAVAAPPTVDAAVTSTQPGVVPRSGVDTHGSALPVVLSALAGGVFAWAFLGNHR